MVDVDDPATLWQSSFDPKRPTRIITHGWKSSAEADIVQLLKKGKLRAPSASMLINSPLPFSKMVHFNMMFYFKTELMTNKRRHFNPGK